MKHEKGDLKTESAMLAKGILRTFQRDVMAAGVGVVVGAILGLIVGYFLGGALASFVKIGALVGFIISLLSRSTFSALFEYDDPPKGKR